MAFLSAALLLSCSDNSAVRLRYEAEKALHAAQKHLKDAGVKPELVDSQTLKAITDQFGQVVEFCYQALDSIDDQTSPVEHREVQHLVFESSTSLSQLFYTHQRFDTCTVILNRLLNTVHLDSHQLVATYVNLGQALQASGSWDSALAVYNGAVERFYPPVDDSGEVILDLFNLPAHIFRVVNLIGDSLAAAGRFSEAEQYYNRLISGYPGTKLAVAARANLARLYDDTKQWDKELAQLSAVLDSASQSNPGSPASLAVQIRIADLYGAKIKDLSHALKLYDKILDELDVADTLIRPLVLFKAAMVTMEQEKYSRARKMLVDLKEDYPRFFAVTPMAQYGIARSFELENNWPRAEAEYTYLIENYRGSDEAMSTYLHIADLFEEQGRKREAARWYAEAEQYFDEVAALGAGTVAEAKALAYKADLYRQKRDWNHSARILLELFDKYPQSEPGHRALLKASAIYRKELGDKTTADSLIAVLRATVTEVEPEQEK